LGAIVILMRFTIRFSMLGPISKGPALSVESETEIITQIRESARDLGLEPSRCVLAFSGGSDSTCLFHLLIRSFGPVFWCCHFNFYLRDKDSDNDQKAVEKLCNDNKVSLLIVNTMDSPGSWHEPGVEVWARNHRLSFFNELKARGFTVILAHHRSDLIENVIFRMSRGTSIKRLFGMQAFDNGTWRPLLDISKSFIEEYLSAHKLPFCRDLSNDSMELSRNFIRHRLIPSFEKLFPGSSEKLLDLAQEGQEKSEFVRRMIMKELNNNRLPLDFFNANNPSVCFEALEVLYDCCSKGVQIQWSRQLLNDILQRLRKKGSKIWSYDLPKSFRFVCESEWVWIDNKGKR
jgi:tRNA(Ile)-lysidine synthetase-like protein